MNITDKTRTITAVHAVNNATLHLSWSDETTADLDLRAVLNDRAFAALSDPVEFAKVQVGDWGHSLSWPSGAELSADVLWLETLSAIGHDDARLFLEWRVRNALSLSKAADALGISRRMIAYYSNGEKKVPRPILLACRGWEVGDGTLTDETQSPSISEKIGGVTVHHREQKGAPLLKERPAHFNEVNSRTITALFDKRTDAQAAAIRLKASSICAENINIYDQITDEFHTAEVSTSQEPGMWASIKNAFLPDEDRHTYEEGVRRGGYLLTADVTKDQVDAVVRVLEEADTVSVQRRAVDRLLTDAGDAFRERTIDVTATGEEAVVGKIARVVEEVIIFKTAGERVEEINETVRRTDVEIDEDTDFFAKPASRS